MTLSDIPEERAKQLVAIPLELATAKKYIQKDLRNYISRIIEPYDKVGLDDSIFEFAELVGYRINNKLEDIAEDLDLEERYDLINDQPRTSVCMAFRGHHNKEFMPDYQFDGLLGKETNDMIEEIRYEKNGRKVADMINPETEERYVVEAGRIGGQATIETHGDQMRNCGRASVETHGDQMRNGGRASVETHGDQMRNGGRARALAQGQYVWSLEEIADIGELKYGEGLTWNDTTSEMNEKYDKDFTTDQVKKAYHNNKDLLPEDENEVKVKNVMERLQTELYNLMSKDLSVNIPAY